MSETHLVSWTKCVRFRVLCHINLSICCDIIPENLHISGIFNYSYPAELQLADINQNKDYPPIPFGVDKHIITFLK